METIGGYETTDWFKGLFAGVKRHTWSRGIGNYLGPGPEHWQFEGRLSIFESWLELKTHPLFQLHQFTEEFTTLLENADYGRDAKNFKAIQVEALGGYGTTTRGVTSVCLSLVILPGNSVASKGLLVHVRPKIEGRDEATRLEILGFPSETNLVMDEEKRIVSITSSYVRLCSLDTSRLFNTMGNSYVWGEFDRRYPGGYLADPPAEDMASLLSLTP